MTWTTENDHNAGDGGDDIAASPSEASPLVVGNTNAGSNSDKDDEKEDHDDQYHAKDTTKSHLVSITSVAVGLVFGMMLVAFVMTTKNGFRVGHEFLRTSNGRGTSPPLLQQTQASITKDKEEGPTSAAPPTSKDTNVNEVFPKELVWTKACPTSYYDFVGTLKFCDGTDSTKAYPTFGYRLASRDPCGTHGINPLIRILPGYRYLLRLENESNNETTNIHTHGLHISGSGNSDDVDRSVTPGNVLLYNWTIPHDHPDGTFWYHAHFYPTTKKHVNGGAYGVLLVDQQNSSYDDGRPHFLESHERFLLLGTHHPTKTKSLQYTNGHPPGQASLSLVANQWTRLRVIIADANAKVRHLRFDPTVCQTHVVAYDGVWRSTVPHPESRSVYSLTGANRLDLAVQCNASSGVWYAVNNIEGEPVVRLHAQQETGEQEAALTKIGTNDAINPWTPQRPSYLQLPQSVKDSNNNNNNNNKNNSNNSNNSTSHFNVSMTSDTLNGVSFQAATPLGNFELDSNGQHNFHEWSIVNTSLHPFHLHTYWMQIATPGGCGNIYEEGEWFDTISKPVELDNEPCLVRFRMNDISGRIIMHCHVLSHEDAGTMGWVMVNGGCEPGTDRIDQEPIPTEISSYDPNLSCLP